MKMKSKKGKNMLALLLAFAMIVTGIVVTPVNAQAAKKEKKATIADMYAYGDLALSTQEGYYEKKPYQISVKDAIVNRNKKAKYTFYSCNTKKIKVTKSGKITFPQPKIKVTVKKKKAIVAWKKLKAAKGYYVYRREAKGKKYTKWKKVKNIKKNTTVKYKDSKLKKGKTYQYKVVAYNRKNKGTSAIKKIVIK